MSTKATPKATPAFEPGVVYDVELAGTVKVGRRTLTPMHSYEIDGSLLGEGREISGEKIKSAKRRDG